MKTDEDKRFAWPAYQAGYRHHYRVPVRIVVITHSEAVARWAAEPLVIDDGASMVVPVVIGPKEIPRIDEPGITPSPELAVLSTMAHGRGRDAAAIGRAAFAALEHLDPEQWALYADVVVRYLSKRVREKLEAQMKIEGYTIQNKWLREAFTKAQARGEAEGQARGLASALLEVLEGREIEVDEQLRQRVLECRDEKRLGAWLRRAAKAESLADVFE